eukprot:UN09442
MSEWVSRTYITHLNQIKSVIFQKLQISWVTWINDCYSHYSNTSTKQNKFLRLHFGIAGAWWINNCTYSIQ